MVVNRRKKFSRQRGSFTHGWGSKKKHRGAGNRGGKGLAGTGKRADSIKTLYWKDKKYFGKHGFKPKGTKKYIKAINLSDINERLDKSLANKLIVKEGDHYVVDLKKLGYNKLLGAGKVVNKFKINVKYASGKAIKRIKQAGGEVILENSGQSSSEHLRNSKAISKSLSNKFDKTKKEEVKDSK